MSIVLHWLLAAALVAAIPAAVWIARHHEEMRERPDSQGWDGTTYLTWKEQP